MSIVVKGAKMPNNCGTCPLRLAWCRQRLYMITRPERCPLEPVRKGTWIETEEYWKCSVCGAEFVTDVGVTPKDARIFYCPVCGSLNEGGNDET